jgi:hypothetical protein
MITIGYCAKCNEYYGRKYNSLDDLYNEENTHKCQEASA